MKKILSALIAVVTLFSLPVYARELSGQVATPVITPNGGDFALSQKVTIKCDTEDAIIYYTTNGDYPTILSTKYKKAFTIDKDMTIKAIAVKKGMTESEVVTVKFKKRELSDMPGVLLCYITYDTNGGSEIAKKKYAYGEKTIKPDDPTKEDFDFAGWYKDKELAEPFKFGKAIDDSYTLYAKWTPVDYTKRQIVLTIGDKKAVVFGKSVKNDVPPIIVNNRTMLPARFVAEKLGAKVEWDEVAQEVKITKDETEIVLTIGSDKALVNGEEVTVDSPVFIENERTYTPVRFIAENLGARVEWDGDNQKVTITKA